VPAELHETIPGVLETRINHMITVQPLIDVEGGVSFEIASVIGDSAVCEPYTISLDSLIEALEREYTDNRVPKALTRITEESWGRLYSRPRSE